MSSNTRRLVRGASGSNVGIETGPFYVEDVFSTYLYAGNSSTQTITNGIDLSGKGGMVWIKSRNQAFDHTVVDTDRGISAGLTNRLSTNTSASSTPEYVLNSFDSTGFTLRGGFENAWNQNTPTTNYASWTFRKQAKFFDVVTYTGNSVVGADQTINHNLGSTPGCIIVKKINAAAPWTVYHRQQSGTPENSYLTLNSTAAVSSFGSNLWSPSSTSFNADGVLGLNDSGDTYVAYLFAHDAGGFGDSGNESVVKCGSYTNNSSQAVEVDLGWEPQWVLIKSASGGGDWIVVDTMRGAAVIQSDTGAGTGPSLSANSANAESATGAAVKPTSTGFKVQYNVTTNQNSAATTGTVTYIYIAIRRGPMKTPTDATKVFDVDAFTSNNSSSQVISVGFPADMILARERTTTENTASQWPLGARLLGNGYLRTTQNAAEVTFLDMVNGWDDQNSIDLASIMIGNGSRTEILYSFRRAPGFFDAVAYTGTGAARTVSHNLGVAPEMMIIKKRSTTGPWQVYHTFLGNSQFIRIDETSAAYPGGSGYWNYTAPTSSVFSLGLDSDGNGSGMTYVAYLFASCPGVSKVGSYIGTGTTLNIDCGFTNGARFVLIKRTDSTGDWYVWDTARGIVGGNDPYLLLNSTAAEVTNTDFIDPLSSGFQISSTAPAAINANGSNYIYLAIA